MNSFIYLEFGKLSSSSMQRLGDRIDGSKWRKPVVVFQAW